MRAAFTTILSAFFYFASLSQQVNRSEYFFDTDPGFGNATSLLVTSGDSVTINGNINIPGSLTAGLHVLFVRVADANSKWSFPSAFLVMISNSKKQIKAVEYFYDNDPGVGNANLFSFTPADSATITQPLTIPDTMKSGVHVLFTRSQNENGDWGMLQAMTINLNTQSIRINAIEYFIDTDPGIGNGTIINFTETDTATINQNISIPGNLSYGQHTLFVRSRNSKGVWGFKQPSTFNVCTIYGPQSKFDYVVDAKNIYFTNSSEGTTSYYWKFGDGSTSIQTNPTHIYTNGGTYQVSLGTNNICGTDTLKKIIYVKGVQSVFPNYGPSHGVMIFEVKGYGFDSTTKIKLHRNGITIPTGKTIFGDSTTLKVICKNDTLALGNYDIIAVTGTRRDTLLNAITIQPTENNQLWFDIVGPDQVLINRFTTFSIRYGNRGNNAIAGVPVCIMIPGDNPVITINKIDTTGSIASVHALSEYGFLPITDSITNIHYKLGLFVIPYMEPHSENSIQLEIKTPTAGFYSIIMFHGKESLYNVMDLIEVDSVSFSSRPMFDCNEDNWSSCFKCLMGIGDNTPGLSCITSTISLGCKIREGIGGWGSSTGSQKLGTLIGLGTAAAGAVANCIPGVGGGAQAVYTGLRGAFQAAKEFKDAFDGAMGQVQLGADCLDCFWDYGKKIFGRSSWDPNIKTGPLGPKSEKYISGKENAAYTIYFENLASATAPATQVTITDTLDLNKINANSFSFTGFGFGDTVSYSFRDHDTSFAYDIDLRPNKNTIVRITGIFEPSIGAIKFQFSSYDPATMDLTTVINNGFLPPNTTGSNGQGFVSFLIQPKEILTTADSIKNTAKIVFDYNPPINTPVWKNTIDKQQPVSNIVSPPIHVSDSTYRINISGNDQHSGIKRYKVYYSINDSAYHLGGLVDTTNFLFIGRVGSLYKFYSVAVDSVNNIEPPPSSPDLILQIVPAPLPVTWLDFKAYKRNNVAQLEWSTANEFNNKGFEIQRSENGIYYEIIGWVNGAGNTNSTQHYFFIDNAPKKGINFYRLNQLDIDNHSYLSQIRKVVFTENNDFLLIPNPAKDFIQIIFPNINIEKVQISDVSGRILWETKSITSPTLSVPLQNFAAGVYLIQVENKDGQITSKKLIKS